MSVQRYSDNACTVDVQQHASQTSIYRIRVRGHVDRQWSDWFDGWQITQKENGETLLSGPVVDQAALFGLLRKVRDLGVPLISVTLSESDRTVAVDAES